MRTSKKYLRGLVKPPTRITSRQLEGLMADIKALSSDVASHAKARGIIIVQPCEVENAADILAQIQSARAGAEFELRLIRGLEYQVKGMHRYLRVVSWMARKFRWAPVR